MKKKNSENKSEILPDEEDSFEFGAKEIRTFFSVVMLIVFFVALIYEINRPESLAAPLLLFLSFLTFILLSVEDRD